MVVLWLSWLESSPVDKRLASVDTSGYWQRCCVHNLAKCFKQRQPRMMSDVAVSLSRAVGYATITPLVWMWSRVPSQVALLCLLASCQIAAAIWSNLHGRSGSTQYFSFHFLWSKSPHRVPYYLSNKLNYLFQTGGFFFLYIPPRLSQIESPVLYTTLA